MAMYSRKDIEALVKRLEGRANNILADEQPQLARDMQAAAAVIRAAMAGKNIEAVEVANA